MNKNLIHKKELEFFGKVTACISHELNNVLSIINEYTGLLEDLMINCNNGEEVDKEKIQKITKNISEQIQRKKELIKLLNRFAHLVDSPISTFNFNELLNDLILVLQRFTSLKKVKLELYLSEVQINLTTSPFVLQHAIFQLINLALDFCNANDTITIQIDKEEFYHITYITSPAIEMNNETNETIEFIADLMEMISGKVEFIPEDTNQKFSLFFPGSISDLHNDN